eukprot:1212702-Amphidinium_carterae.1
MLPDTRVDSDDRDARLGEQTEAVHRLREVSLQQVVEQSARDRIARAEKAHTRLAAQQHDLSVGQEVDFYRDQTDREASGWRGPAVVVDMSRATHGRIGLRTMADRHIVVRSQDVRPRL